MSLEIASILFDERANNGTWCKLPYPNHPDGCPNYPECINKTKAIGFGEYNWYAVVEEFDLEEHAKRMKANHPKWTNRQCRCLLYWQGSLRKRLLAKAKTIGGDIILPIPEAYGINIFETMMKVGVVIERNPRIVRKVMFIGIRS